MKMPDPIPGNLAELILSAQQVRLHKVHLYYRTRKKAESVGGIMHQYGYETDIVPDGTNEGYNLFVFW